MMDAFSNCLKVESESMKILMPLFEFSWSDNGRFVTIEKGNLAKELQQTYGDVFTNLNGRVHAIEIKSEWHFTGNLFLETWSNYNVNPGWLFKLKSDWLFYHFLENNTLYIIDFNELRKWTNNDNLIRFREVQQKKYTQFNNTRGRIVPIDILRNELKNFKYIDLNTTDFFTSNTNSISNSEWQPYNGYLFKID